MADSPDDQTNTLANLVGYDNEQKIEETAKSEQSEPTFIPHRVFINHVDAFNGLHISAFLTDQICGASKAGGDEEGGEEEEEVGGEDQEPKTPKVALSQLNKYEIIGTLKRSFHKKSEDILLTLDENQEDFIENIWKCGFVIYDITQDPGEIPKALATLTAIENEIEKIQEVGPKTFGNFMEMRTFILISSVMTWANTKLIDPEEPETPFTEKDYKKRKTHPNYIDHIACEREVVLKGRKYKNNLKAIVVASGIIYGAEEEDLAFIFKLAWNNEKELPLFGPGKNSIPLIHISDLIKVIHALLENVPPKKQYILAVEQTPATLKQIVKELSKAMGRGRTREVSVEEAFLYKDVTQAIFDRCTVSLIMEPEFITEDLAVEWQNEMNLAENMPAIVAEFRKTRNLKPMRLFIHGPPTTGKTRIAKKLFDYYGCHYVSVKSAIDETINDLKETIEREEAKIKLREEKEKALEESGGVAEEEAGEEGVEEEGGDIEELQEQLKEIEAAMAESEDGKLPDEYVNRFVKAIISSNPCKNKGFVLDGYPKTIAQAKELFGQAAEGGEEEAEEEEEGGGGDAGGASKLLPDFVITLQATDKFLCDRIMALPEKMLQGTHYTEEHMLRRLAEFRRLNTEDDTVLNFFDEIEIHPMVINVMDDNTEEMDQVMGTILPHLGPPSSFGPSVEEEEEMMRMEEERLRLIAEHGKLQKELLELKVLEDHQTKMEEWAALLEQLQMEEEKLLAAQSEPLRNYLIKFVFPTLSKGLLEVARMKPEDPVDFLAEYLFKENSEGRMFDPAYTRDGEHMIEAYQEQVEPTAMDDETQTETNLIQ